MINVFYLLIYISCNILQYFDLKNAPFNVVAEDDLLVDRATQLPNLAGLNSHIHITYPRKMLLCSPSLYILFLGENWDSTQSQILISFPCEIQVGCGPSQLYTKSHPISKSRFYLSSKPCCLATVNHIVSQQQTKLHPNKRMEQVESTEEVGNKS